MEVAIMSYKTICVPVALQRYLGFTPISLRQRDLAVKLAGAYGADLHVLTVEAPVTLLPGLETTEDKLKRFVNPLVEQGIQVVTALRKGRPSRKIFNYVTEVKADLVLIGSHSKRGPLDVGLGSTASSLAHDLPATVLMIRPMTEDQERTRELMIPRYPMIFPYG
jgi:nucleotide-binding universal stress UspA family protein